uniref:Uncharacterized protein n=1 Tax=Opuntia streptacantha TaxID=393608 RepID=A0A7C9DL13_OPUST
MNLEIDEWKLTGFKETQIASCGSGEFNGDFTCQKKDRNFTVCSDPSDCLWFDGGHPTEEANRQFSEEFTGGSANLVAPYNLRLSLTCINEVLLIGCLVKDF